MPLTKILLEEQDIPSHWYNVVADMPSPPTPPLGPDGQPVGPEQRLTIFPANILEQEMSAERWIPIPEAVREVYRLWRPSPLVRAHRLEKVLDTPARIYYEGCRRPARTSPTPPWPRPISTSRPASAG